MNSHKLKVLGIIPARFASTRFPGKPLVIIEGKTMIQRVYEQAQQTQGIDQIVVATDDEKIAQEVENFGGKFIMTSSNHQSGTDRCAEVAQQYPNFDIIINIQGDEPFISPEQIDLLISCFQSADDELATLIKVIKNEGELFNSNIPKVIINTKQEAIYFSRQTIPYQRNTKKQSEWLDKHIYYKHIGIYGYSRKALLAIADLKPSSLELSENLEQLRWIENGYKIKTRITTHETIAIDTPEDLEKILRRNQ